jgi:pyruvate formate lyase activating enzyme
VLERLGPDVPLHFTAFHPDWKMRDVLPTPARTLRQARDIAMAVGLRYVYTGNIHDAQGQSTYCHACGQLLIERDWYRLGRWNLTADGACNRCGTLLPGVFEAQPGTWGPIRRPVRVRRSGPIESRGGPLN